YAGERKLYREADESIDNFERASDRTLSLLASGAIHEARQNSRLQMRPQAERASAALGSLIDFNTGKITDMSMEIVSIRRRTATLSLTLHALAATLALLMVILV